MRGGREACGIQLPEETSTPVGNNGVAFAPLQNLKEHQALEQRPDIIMMTDLGVCTNSPLQLAQNNE